MRKLKFFEHISLDGVIQPSSENGFPYKDWTAPYRSPAGLAMLMEIQGDKFDLLLGRRTYDIWSAYWPQAPKSPMSDQLNGAAKYIVTHRPESLQWGPFEAVGPDLVEGVRKIKATGGADIFLWGSSTLTSTLLEKGLVDEVILLTYPVLIGQGKKFFAEGTPARALALESSKTSPTGVLINRYKVLEPLPK